MKFNRLSVIVPCYNEALTLSRTLHALCAALIKLPVETELILVDDGSTDKTKETAERILREYDFPSRIYRNEKNKGKGAAVAIGVKIAEGDYVLFLDADLSTSLEALQTLMNILLENGDPIIIGSRMLPTSQVIQTQNIFRRLSGNLYRKIGIIFLGLHVSDVGCGFKCFEKNVAQELFSKLTVFRWSFDAEILFLAKKFKIPVREIPVVWKNDADSRLSLWRDGFRVFGDLWKIQKNNFYGVYERK